MSVCLLDVNVLIALAWPGHEFHTKARHWFAQKGSRGWATCPITQAGFVRISSNPTLSPQSVSVREAVQALAASLQHPGHHFWHDDVSFPEAVALFGKQLVGHKQITDAYLLALAVHKKGTLATLDSGPIGLIASAKAYRNHIELIS